MSVPDSQRTLERGLDAWGLFVASGSSLSLSSLSALNRYGKMCFPSLRKHCRGRGHGGRLAPHGGGGRGLQADPASEFHERAGAPRIAGATGRAHLAPDSAGRESQAEQGEPRPTAHSECFAVVLLFWRRSMEGCVSIRARASVASPSLRCCGMVFSRMRAGTREENMSQMPLLWAV